MPPDRICAITRIPTMGTDDERVVAGLLVECELRADLYELADEASLRIHVVPPVVTG
jgi:hypothetical protein